MGDLEHSAEFHKHLDTYRLSETAARSINRLTLVLLVGPSSSGRNAVIRELVKTGEFHYIVSDTTREPRTNDGVPEENGREYWFRSSEDVLDDIKTGHYLEAAIIHKKHVYGISVRELNKALQDNKIAITDIEIVGAANIHRAKPDASIIFVIPPSFPVWIERLHHRGALPEEEVRRRLESALVEFDAALTEDYYTYVINDALDEAVAAIYEMSKLGRVYRDNQLRGRALIEQLIKDTRSYLYQA
ncbi:MAG TPA: hypothetical protein VK983_02510 [Candidatus Limnocylindrales bacterium]|nr:hypothetical protein [Candidatus Limnocylindrales bacterium]